MQEISGHTRPNRRISYDGLPRNAFRVHRNIRFSHTDPAGIVYFPVYFDMFNGAVEDWFTHGLKLNYARMILDDRIGLPIVHAECDFITPSRLGEAITLGIILEKLGTGSIGIRILGEADGQLRLSGRLTVVTASLDGFAAIPMPGHLRSALESYQSSMRTGSF